MIQQTVINKLITATHKWMQNICDAFIKFCSFCCYTIAVRTADIGVMMCEKVWGLHKHCVIIQLNYNYY
jgi:hypothetical protein